MKTTRVLPNLLIALDHMVDGIVEGHKPGGITGYDLGQNPGGCAYLIVSTLVRLNPPELVA
jgi:hypothetical protein